MELEAKQAGTARPGGGGGNDNSSGNSSGLGMVIILTALFLQDVS